MSILDIFLIIPICYGAYKGFTTGLIVQVATIASLFLGVYAAIKLSDVTADWLTNNYGMEPSSMLPFIAFFLTFVAVAVGVFFLGKIISAGVKPTLLSPINKFGGLGIGALKYLYLVGIAIVFFETINERKGMASDETLHQSTLYHPILKTTVYTIPALKESSLFLKNQLFNDSSELNLKMDQARRAKEIADSLGIDGKEAEQMLKIYKDYQLDTIQ